jgi:hypothetical protein
MKLRSPRSFSATLLTLILLALLNSRQVSGAGTEGACTAIRASQRQKFMEQPKAGPVTGAGLFRRPDAQKIKIMSEGPVGGPRY